MTQDPLFYLVVIAMAAVVIILMTGIGSFGAGGEFHRRNANRLMRWRIYAQFVAVALILFFVWMRSSG